MPRGWSHDPAVHWTATTPCKWIDRGEHTVAECICRSRLPSSVSYGCCTRATDTTAASTRLMTSCSWFSASTATRRRHLWTVSRCAGVRRLSGCHGRWIATAAVTPLVGTRSCCPDTAKTASSAPTDSSISSATRRSARTWQRATATRSSSGWRPTATQTTRGDGGLVGGGGRPGRPWSVDRASCGWSATRVVARTVTSVCGTAIGSMRVVIGRSTRTSSPWNSGKPQVRAASIRLIGRLARRGGYNGTTFDFHPPPSQSEKCHWLAVSGRCSLSKFSVSDRTPVAPTTFCFHSLVPQLVYEEEKFLV